MTKKVILTLKDEEFEKIKKLAKKKKLKIKDFIREEILDCFQPQLTLQKILNRLPGEKGKIFTVKKLFKKTEWDQFSTNSRITRGKAFATLVKFLQEGRRKIKFAAKSTGNNAAYKIG